MRGAATHGRELQDWSCGSTFPRLPPDPRLSCLIVCWYIWGDWSWFLGGLRIVGSRWFEVINTITTVSLTCTTYQINFCVRSSVGPTSHCTQVFPPCLRKRKLLKRSRSVSHKKAKLSLRKPISTGVCRACEAVQRWLPQWKRPWWRKITWIWLPKNTQAKQECDAAKPKKNAGGFEDEARIGRGPGGTLRARGDQFSGRRSAPKSTRAPCSLRLNTLKHCVLWSNMSLFTKVFSDMRIAAMASRRCLEMLRLTWSSTRATWIRHSFGDTSALYWWSVHALSHGTRSRRARELRHPPYHSAKNNY